LAQVAIQRTELAHPELEKIKEKDLTEDQNILYQRDANDLHDEITEAKYAQHPNWRRVESLFPKVKEDLKFAVNSLKIPDDQKQEKLKIINEVKLILPSRNPAKIIPFPGCDTTEINAYFDYTHGTFTVCAGLFNSFQSDNAMYTILAHEIGHSIDPIRCARCRRKVSSGVASSLNKLVNSGNKPTYSCNEWEEVKKPVLAAKDRVQKPQFDALQGLYDCLGPKKDLKPFDEKAVNTASERQTVSGISDYATATIFTQLAQPTKRNEDGQTVENEYYMRPDRVMAALSSHAEVKNADRDFGLPELFHQSLSCVRETIDGKNVGYLDSDKSNRKILFAKAIKETKEIVKANSNDWLSYCGNNCDELQADQLSVNSQENFADWIATRALQRRLSQIPSLDSRREAISVSSYIFLCEEPSALSEAPDLTSTEKRFSLEVHPENRVRRLAVFGDRNAELAQCKISPEEQGFGKCEP
jgi:hypothetical protein